VELLPYTELSHNIKEHTTTKKSPFEILNGRKPEWPMAFRVQSEMQLAEEQIKQINLAREEAQASMKIAADSIKLKDSIHRITGMELKKGDEVWLEGKNLKNSYPTVKLASKRFGPFEIEEEVGIGAYQLKLPKAWKIHPVFHASLLTPYVKMKEYREQYSRPLPDLINDKEEYEVETITKSRKQGQGFAVCVKWKGYPDLENTWIPLSQMGHAMDLVREFHWNNKDAVGPPQEALRLMQIYCTAERKWQKMKINIVRKSQTTQNVSQAIRK
jgi:hypothetical protein